MAYRPAKLLPYELYEHCRIYFEEELYSQALILLTRLLVSNTSISTAEAPIPAFIPTPHLVSIIATLIVHPSFNTRTDNPDARNASNEALHLLRAINALVGPVNAQFGAAFQFADSHAPSSRAKRLSKRKDGADGSGALAPSRSEDDFETVKTTIANEGSLFAKAGTFWHAVGWAFNCSAKWPSRWRRWKLWLELMMDVLEADWNERARLAEEAQGAAASEPVLEDSLIIRYLFESGFTDRAAKRRVMRSIFADGSQKAMAEFPEVFRKETKELQTKEPKRAKQRVNVDDGEFGDYDTHTEDADDVDVKAEQSETTSSRHSARQARHISSRPATPDQDAEMEDAGDQMGTSAGSIEASSGTDSRRLRCRLLALLSRVSLALPFVFSTLEDLLDLYVEFIRPLPIQNFALLASPPVITDNQRLSKFVQEQLNQMLLRPLLTATPPQFEFIDLTQDKLQRHFLPHAANASSVVDNAKVSILLESLVRLVKGNFGLTANSGFGQAVRKGIQARNEKATIDNRSRAEAWKKEEAQAVRWLDGSTRRLEYLVRAVEG